VPDITNVQVQINTEAPGYSPLEAEQRVTFPIETALAGLPRLDYTRSLSRYGLSQVTVVFEDGTDIYFARQQVAERLQRRGQLPPGSSPRWARSPPASARSSCTRSRPSRARAGRTAATTRPTCARCRTGSCGRSCADVPGVTEVNTIGGYARQIHVTPDPAAVATASRCSDLVEAIAAQQPNVGAGYIERNGEQYLVRVPGQVAGPRRPESAIVVSTARGRADPLRDVARSVIGPGAAHRRGHRGRPRSGARHGVHAGRREQPRGRARRRRAAGRGPSQPAGGRHRERRSTTAPRWSTRTIATVQKNLAEGALLVIAVLFLLLGNMRAALITAR
jgi:heavy metal efflux system protein